MFVVLAMSLVAMTAAIAASPETSRRIEAALDNVTVLVRPGRVGYATIWDGNKYVQCRRTEERSFRCEAAGSAMQPSLRNVLSPERVRRLTDLGWQADPRFGNFVRVFPADLPPSRIAGEVIQVLADAFDADTAGLDVQTAWVVDMPCPPRNGMSQNLAGLINDAPSMRRTAHYGCSFAPGAGLQAEVPVTTADALVERYRAVVTAEIQRLRINLRGRIHVVFGAGIGYLQCMPAPAPPAIYCEAQSRESWAALAAVMTPERLARLRQAGYSDPGRSPNHAKLYPLEAFDDAGIATEILRLLHEVYGYAGTPPLAITTE